MRKLRLPGLEALLGRREQPSRQGQPPALVIVGLGNPGPQYAKTRHNVGFWCIDRIAQKHGITLERRHQTAHIGEGAIEGRPVVLTKPRTYVNRSGEAVNYLLARYRVTPAELLVIYDDIALPPGKLRLRGKGSAGGHNGIKSIIEATGTQDFPRLRVGVGHPPPEGEQIAHVLGALPPDERKAVDEAVERAVEAVSALLIEGIDAAMGKYN